MTLVILAAGMGSRYGGLKQLDPMTKNGEFILDFSVFDAKSAGFDKVVFIIKEEMQELFAETVGNRISKQIEVAYAYQKPDALPAGYAVPEGRVKPWGTGHALLCAKEAVGKDSMMVINADDFYGRETFKAISAFLKENKGKNAYCMAGYILKNTLTENGSVSRGICEVDGEGYLKGITERTKIYRAEDGNVVFMEEDVLYPTDENGYCSMNCWGFTPAIFAELEEGFAEFLAGDGDPIKREFYLPSAVDRAMKKGRCTVSVLPTEAKWYGVTYPEDKAFVMSSIRELIDGGVYPDGLFEN
ncbi:MAG: NTP transferase domain-containing protein [Clostridia bacterium]|nr:NTP transferase domain-containing protein [Clostridia bacterium]